MSGPLCRRLAEIRAEKEAARPAPATAIMNAGTEALQASGILDRVPRVGDRAPLFARPSVAGPTVRLQSLLRRGPVVLSFFRGRW
ncbi:hypothetical protein [Candidatus Palauibacter sp.]|uniref:hypothetical protein n=1 Tax=Candidatus Palauibacter sp. TaxID=3101350 RepID=UPI003B01F7F5